MNNDTHSSPNHSRREFLKTTATLAAATTLGGLDLSRSAHAAGSDILRVGMIGCGGRCTGAAENALSADPGTRLVAMCDVFKDRVLEKRKYLQNKKPNQVTVDDDHCFDGVDGYKHVIASSDVVLIANAAKFHPYHLRAAIQAGKHAFIEKPHAIDPAGVKVLREALALAQEKKLCVVSGLQSRYHQGIIATVQQIQDGAIGEVVAIEENWLRAPYGLYERKPGMTETEFQFSNQYHFHWLSGDDLVQTLAHNLDRSNWVMRNQPPVKVHGMGGRSSLVGEIYGSVFDHHSATYEFANGVRLFAACRTINNCHEEVASLVLGTKGRASLLGCRIWGEKNWQYTGKSGNAYQIEHDRLFAAIRAGVPLNNGEYMVPSTLTVVMGQISCYTGKQVTWDQISQSDFNYPPKAEDCRMDMEPPVTPGPHGSYPVYVPGQTKLI